MSEMVTWASELARGWLPSILITLVIVILVSSVLGGRPKNFPPGMLILPCIGSLWAMPLGPTRSILRNLKKKYGNMASFGIFGTRFILVSGVRTLKEVFAMRSTSDRPQMILTTGKSYVISKGRSGQIGVLGTSGQVWQEQRRFLLHHLRDLGFGKTSYEPILVEEIAELVDHLALQEGQPINMRRFFNRSVVNVIWGMMVGKRYSYDHAKLKKLLETFVQPADFNLLSPVFYIPNIFRVMPHIPILKNHLDPIAKIYEFLKGEIQLLLEDKERSGGNNFAAVYLKEIQKRENTSSSFSMDQLSAMIFEMFMAGMETTSSTLTTAIYFMTKNPSVQRRVQEELDEVVGQDRLPSYTDMERLPYNRATIHEVQRVFNLTLFALPHLTSEDCTLAGYDIPKGTVLLPNLDDVHTSSENWKNASQFDPENFLDDKGMYRKNDAFMPFGVGKRMCAGEPLAKMELFFFFTHLLQRFTFTIHDEHEVSNNNPMFNSAPYYTIICHSRF